MFDVTVETSGFEELRGMVSSLITSPHGTREVRKTVMSGLRVVGKEIKAQTPVEKPLIPPRRWRRPAYTGQYRFAQPGRLKAATGRSKFSRGTGRGRLQKVVTAKTGTNIGVKGSPKDDPPYPFAPHGHLVALGTTVRYTKKGASRGKMWGRQPNPHHVPRATEASASRALEQMAETWRTDLQSTVDAARK